MTLPVSSYEELLARVRSLTSETIQLRREITSSLCDSPVLESASLPSNINYGHHIKTHSTALLERASTNEDLFEKKTKVNKKMFDEKEIEELYDEFLNLDGNMFLESGDNEMISNDMNINCIKNLPNLKNNNFIGPMLDFNRDKSDATTNLDLLNENFINLNDNILENTVVTSDLRANGGKSVRGPLLLDKKEDEIDNEFKEIDEKLSSPDAPDAPDEKNSFHQNGCWAFDTLGLWHSGPSSLNLGQTSNNYAPRQDLTASYNSFEPQCHSFSSSSKRTYSHQQLGAKVEMVYTLLSMLDMDNREDMSKTFLAMSSSPESCHAMRQSGCLPLLIQLIHSFELNKEVRKRAAEALSNIVHSQIDEKRRRREVRVLKLLQQVREYCDELKSTSPQEILSLQDSEKHPINAIGTLMKFSFDAEHRQAICTLGGLHAISELIQVDHEMHGSTNDDTLCITLRRYAGMSLTNLTFGDGKNKSLLCSFNKFMRALVDQLKSPSEDLRQVTASVLRNLSWRADSESKESLRNVGAVTALTISAMEGKKESTLKSILSALWNLSAHCSLNKIDICSVPGALTFLVKMLRYKSSSNTLAIVENAGGILRNISSHIAVREDYRQILRNNNCFEVLLEQLKSPSLTIVSNACGTLWNLSARCPEDQRRLWEMGATSMLRSLVQSKHKMISMGSSAALKNLLAANPNENLLTHLDSTAKSLGLQNLPTLFVRKKRALEQELNITLAETCDNIDPIGSPTHFNSPHEKVDEKKACGPRRSDSRDSVQSTHSDSTYERINQITHKNEEKLFENKNLTLHDSLDEKSISRKVEDQKLMRRYKASMIPTPTFRKMNQDRINERTREETVVESHAIETVTETDVEGKTNSDLKEGNKKGIPVLNTSFKNNVTHNNDASSDICSLPNNHFSQSNEKSSFNNEESQLLQAKVVEKHSISNLTLNSQVDKEFMTSNLEFKENNTEKPNRCIEFNKVIENENEDETEDKTDKESRSLNNSEDCISNANSLTANNNELPGTDKNLELDKNTDKRVTENLFEDKISCFSNSLEVQHVITKSTLTNEGFDFNDSISGGDKTLDVKYQEQQNLNIKFPEINSLSKDFVTKDCEQSTLNESLPVGNSGFSKSKILQKNEMDESVNTKQGQCDFFCQKTDLKGQTELNEILPFNTKTFTREIRKETCGKPSQALLESSPNLPQQPRPSAELNLKNRADNHFQTFDGVIVLAQADTRKANFLPYSTHGTDQLQAEDPSSSLKPKQTEIILCNSTEDFSESALNAEDELEKRGNVFPKFKVGSPITDSRVLQMEANKICREIKKHQDFEMGCSLTSEVSLISCSSFLDTGDYSLFDSSTDAIDFDESENLLLSKASSKIKSFPFRKPISSQTIESVSLPSLGSLKNEQFEALDLDSSVLSVASITSEIAETYSKDFENFYTYTKTCKADSENDFVDETAADVTLVSNEDDTLNADSLQNNAEFFDEDSSLHCQENLPLDSEVLQEATSEQIKNKLTPKEKRKTFQERYRTYTIRDFQGCKNSEAKSVINGRDSSVNLTKNSEAPLNNAQSSSQLQDFDFNEFNLDSRNGYAEENMKRESLDFYSENKYETFHFSKSLDRERSFIPDLTSDSKSLNDLLSIGPAERKELVDNAKLVAFSLKTAVQEPEVISDSEMEEPPKSLNIDTATYSKNLRHRCLDEFRPQELQNCEQCNESEDADKIGAKILKPGDKLDEKFEEISKGIRGRRKPLYSSQRNLIKVYDSPLNLPKASQTVTEAKKFLSGTGKPPILNREGTFTKEDGFDLKKVEHKNVRAIPVLHRNAESRNLNSLRTGVKNKTAVPVGNSKRPGEIQVSKIGRPLSTYASRSNERRAESDSSQRRPFSTGSANRTGGDNATTVKRPASAGLVSPKMKNSSSNQNIKVGNNSGNGSFAKSKNPCLQSSKSQSDANLNLAAKDRVSAGKQKTPKKEVTSKIASLWRKVEETKLQNKNVKDSRVWIGPEKSTKTVDEVLIIEQEEILDIPTRKIVHSFTCQALEDETSHFNCHEKDSRNFIRSSDDKADKTERRNIISAVVPPYNYNPPISAPVISSKNKEADTFHKGSLKVTDPKRLTIVDD